MGNTLVEIRSGLETAAYWTHGLIGAFMLIVSIDVNYILYVLFLFPVAFSASFIAMIIGLVSLPTAILSLFLLGIFLKGPDGPIVNVYVLACFIIVGYRIFRIVIDRYMQAH